MPNPRFTNPWPHEEHGLLDIFKWKFNIGKEERPLIPDAPDEPAPCEPLEPSAIATPPEVGWRIVWLGHASFLIQGCGLSVLIDPVFADHCGPFPMKSLMRRSPTPCKLADLPPIDAILLTHSHYDHLDLATLLALGPGPRVIIAEGHARWLSAKLGRQVAELAWHERLDLAPGVTVTATPAQHFSGRTPFDRNRGHWCGWLIEGGGQKIWHAGDSGYCPAFAEIGSRHGPIDFGMIPIGAYQPRSIMKPMHMNPEEAVQAFVDARCQRAVGMHWGTFTLTDEPMSEPPLLLVRELAARSLPEAVFTAPAVGTIHRI